MLRRSIFRVSLFMRSPFDLFDRRRVGIHADGPDGAALDADHPVGHVAEGLVVGDDDDGHAETPAGVLQQLQDRLARVIVQGAGGLVAEKELRVLREGPGDGDALLFAAGELGRKVLRPLFQTHLFQHLPRIQGPGRELRRDLDVLQRREIRDQVIELEHKAHVVPTVGGELGFIKGRDLLPVDGHAAVGEAIHPAQNVQERGLPGAGFPDDHADLAPLDVKTRVMQRRHGHFPRLIDLPHPVKADESLRHGNTSFIFCVHLIILTGVCQEFPMFCLDRRRKSDYTTKLQSGNVSVTISCDECHRKPQDIENVSD